MHDKKTILQKRDEKMTALYNTTIKHPDSMLDVIDEAMVHLIENFEPHQRNPLFRRDYCFIMGKSHMGQGVKDGEDVNPTCTFMAGDMHEFSHDLANMMKEDPNLARFIFHAIDVFRFM